MRIEAKPAGTRAGWPRDHCPAMSASLSSRWSAIACIVPPCAGVPCAEVSRLASRSASRAYSRPDRLLICIMPLASNRPAICGAVLVCKREQGDENSAGWHGKPRVCPLLRASAGAAQQAPVARPLRLRRPPAFVRNLHALARGWTRIS